VTVGHTSGGIMKEKTITITILWGCKNYSKKKVTTYKQSSLLDVIILGFFYRHFSAACGRECSRPSTDFPSSLGISRG